MNILYLTNHLNVGGITSYTLTLAGGMKKRGHNVYIASSGGELLPRFIASGVEYVPIPIRTKSEASFKILVSKYKLLKYMKEKNIDIIHANTRVTQVLACLVRRTYGIPYISTCHGFFKKRFFRKVFPCWGCKVIAISQQVKEHLINDFKVEEGTIRVIHNGIDVEKFKAGSTGSKADAKRKFKLNDGPVIGIIARLSEEKGHVYLINAMREVIVKIPQAQLFIIGDGRMKDVLVRQVKSSGLEKSVFFVTTVTDTREWLSCMDLFVLPSLKEGLGLALMEAMACGLTVIGSDVGGIKNLIQDNYNGLLVKPADSHALSQAILELLQNSDKANYMGTNARTFINQNFSASKMILETEEVYLECLPR